MITQDNFIDLLQNIGFSLNRKSKNEIYTKRFTNIDVELRVDFTERKLIYPNELRASRDTTKDFSHNENFVVFECVNNLFERGYRPENLYLEKATPNGRQNVAGYCDIVVQDNNENEYLIIECKTAGDEYESAWKDVLKDGGQLFNYFNSFRKVQYLCLYTADYNNDNRIIDYKVISMKDNREYLNANKKLKLVSFDEVKQKNGNKDEYFKVWKDTYQSDFNTNGIFENDIKTFDIGKKNYSIDDLKVIDNDSMQKKYNEFASILRKYNVSGKENAFDKLVNLFLVKVVDETNNPTELKFYWKGAAYDDYFSFQDRLQSMYQIGMKKYLKEDVTYYDNAAIIQVFDRHKKKPDTIQETILQYFKELKFYSNNAFAFLDVHNEQLFTQNSLILKEVVQMMQDIKLNTEEQNQFLGDLFEGFLDQGIKQSEGQYFTPLPIVRFLISSLPIETIIKESEDVPLVIDYACGAGHFLNEYANQIKPFVKKYKNNNIEEYYSQIYGIEKESRLSKVSKVASFMYNQNDINIIYADALSNHPKEMGIKDNTFSVLIANPPYSVKGFLETLTEQELQNFELSKNISEISTNNSIETFFIERAKQLLKSNGIAAIILPSSFLTNGNIYISAREILLKYFDIIAISTFESGTFGKTGTSTIALFIRRKNNNPAVCDLFFDRVNAWFNNDETNNDWYNDEYLINEYCQLVGYNIEDYKTLLENQPNDTLLNNEMFQMYKDAFYNDSTAKEIRKKRTKKNRKKQRLYSDEQIQEELDKYVLDNIREREKEKLYYFLLAKDNPRKVIVSKSPTDKTELKSFLGYEWSDSKGKEGIKYLGVSSDNELEKNKGLLNIQTPLFNPNNLMDNDKINTIICNNFLGKNIEIPNSLKEYITTFHLVDMLDFSKVNFDKQIRLAQTKKIMVASKYSMVAIKNFATVSSGDSAPQSIRYFENGTIPFFRVSDLAKEHLSSNLTTSKNSVNAKYKDSFTLYKKGSIIIPKSGASVKLDHRAILGIDGFVVSHCAIIHNYDLKQINHKYLYEYLLTVKSSNIKDLSNYPSLNISDFENIKVPLPPISVQKQIVKECEEVDKEYNNSRMSIDEYKNKISQVFEKLEVITIRGGGFLIKPLSKLLLQITENSMKIPKHQILDKGLYPVITQESEQIITGYTNEQNPIMNIPYIVFGDHSCTFKYIDFPFFRGADGTQLIKTNEKEIILKYLYEYLLTLKIPNVDKYERHFKYLKDMQIVIPTIEKQQQIVDEITVYRNEIARHETLMKSCIDKKQKILDRFLN